MSISHREDVWISAKEALNLAASALGGSKSRGMTVLREKARLGFVAARAQKVSGGKGISYISVPKEFWAPAGLLGMVGAVPFEDWEEGHFGGAALSSVGAEARSVMFLREHVERFFPLSSKRLPKAKRRRPPGHFWHKLSIEMVMLHHSEGIPEGTGTEGSEKVIGKLILRLSEQGAADLPSPSALRPVIKELLLRLRSEP